MGKPAQEVAHLAVADASATELGGNQCRKDLLPPKQFVVVGDKQIAGVANRSSLGKGRSNRLNKDLQIELSRHGDISLIEHRRDPASLIGGYNFKM
jgi:hypothetical protein